MEAVIRIAVVEDELQCAQQLSQYIEDYGHESGRTFSVTIYSDGDQLVEDFKSQYDIILMDVEMPLLDGMSAAGIVRETDQEVVIIFITNMAQYAIKGYAVDALDYVLKPVSYFAFTQRLSRAILHLLARSKAFLAVPVKGGTVKVAVADLYYVESQGHQLIYHTKGGEHHSTGSLQQVEQDLEGQGFFRCNKGYLVNLEHVDGIQDGCAMVKGDSLVVSRGRRGPFLEALADYVGGKRR